MVERDSIPTEILLRPETRRKEAALFVAKEYILFSQFMHFLSRQNFPSDLFGGQPLFVWARRAEREEKGKEQRRHRLASGSEWKRMCFERSCFCLYFFPQTPQTNFRPAWERECLFKS